MIKDLEDWTILNLYALNNVASKYKASIDRNQRKMPNRVRNF